MGEAIYTSVPVSWTISSFSWIFIIGSETLLSNLWVGYVGLCGSPIAPSLSFITICCSSMLAPLFFNASLLLVTDWKASRGLWELLCFDSAVFRSDFGLLTKSILSGMRTHWTFWLGTTASLEWGLRMLSVTRESILWSSSWPCCENLSLSGAVEWPSRSLGSASL